MGSTASTEVVCNSVNGVDLDMFTKKRDIFLEKETNRKRRGVNYALEQVGLWHAYLDRNRVAMRNMMIAHIPIPITKKSIVYKIVLITLPLVSIFYSSDWKISGGFTGRIMWRVGIASFVKFKYLTPDIMWMWSTYDDTASPLAHLPE